MSFPFLGIFLKKTILMVSFHFKRAMVFSKMIFKGNLYWSKNWIKTFELKKITKKSIWESLLIRAGTIATIAAIVLMEVEKRLIWEENLQKVVEILGKVWNNGGNLLKGPKNLFDIGKSSRFQIRRVFLFWSSAKWPSHRMNC